MLAGLLGIGGGVILLPVLALVFAHQGVNTDAIMHVAIGTSLATIVITSLSSIRAHQRRGGIDWRVFRTITPGIIFGGMIGAVIAKQLGGDTLRVTFAVFMLLVAAQMALGTAAPPHRTLPKTAGMLVAGGLAGGVAGELGVAVEGDDVLHPLQAPQIADHGVEEALGAGDGDGRAQPGELAQQPGAMQLALAALAAAVSGVQARGKAELGDKTMLATVTLATQHGWVGAWVGSTLGMVAADALAIVVGRQLGTRLPERAVRYGAAALFVIFGGWLLVDGGSDSAHPVRRPTLQIHHRKDSDLRRFHEVQQCVGETANQPAADGTSDHETGLRIATDVVRCSAQLR